MIYWRRELMMDGLKGLSTSCYASNPTFSLSVLALRHDRFLFLLYCILHVLTSLHLSILTFAPLSLSFSLIALWTQTVQWTKPVWRKKMISRIIRLISYMQHNESTIRAVHTTHALYFRSSKVQWHCLRNRSLVT